MERPETDIALLHEIIGTPGAQRFVSVSDVAEAAIDDINVDLENITFACSSLADLMTTIPAYLMDSSRVSEYQRQTMFQEAAQAIRITSKRAQVRQVFLSLRRGVKENNGYAMVPITGDFKRTLILPFRIGDIAVDFKGSVDYLTDLYHFDGFRNARVEGKRKGVDYILRASQPEGVSLQPIPLQVAQQFDLLDLRSNNDGDLIGHSPTIFNNVELVYHYQTGQKLPGKLSFIIIPV